MKCTLSPPRPFRLSRLDGNRLLVARFDDRASLARCLARAAAHYEKASELHVKANFVGINMPWVDLVSWYERAGHFQREGYSNDAAGEVAGEVRGKENRKEGTSNAAGPSYPVTTEHERLFLIHALWDTSSFAYGAAADFKDYYVEPPPLPPPAYLVAYIDGDPSTLRHELAHALYYLEPDYRTLARSIWDRLPTDNRNGVANALSSLGYDQANHADEFQAYTLEDYKVWSGSGAFSVRGRPSPASGVDPFATASKRLLETFEVYGLERELRELEESGDRDRRYRV